LKESIRICGERDAFFVEKKLKMGNVIARLVRVLGHSGFLGILKKSDL
jgi:hypothetical protein